MRHNRDESAGAGQSHEQDDSGISAEDRQEILAEIDKIAAENKLTSSSDTFVVRPMKKGFLFPLLVNLLGALLLGGGLYGLQALFEQRGEQAASEQSALLTAEGRIIRELRREAEQQLQQKEQEIAQVRNNLQEIESRRRQLEENLDEELAARESVLRQELEQEMAARRDELEREGLSQAEIDAQLEQLSSEREEELQSQLSEIRSQADAERQRLTENLDRLEEQYAGNLEQLRQEQQRIVEQAQEREQELRQQLESRLSASQEELSEARRELNRLSQQQERELEVSTQIAAFYEAARGAIRNDNYDGALQRLENLRQFLNEESIRRLPSVQRRRSAELFIVSSLEELIAGEQARREEQTEDILEGADQIRRARELVEQAVTARETGNLSEAAALNRQALAELPALQQAHRFLMQQSGQAEQLENELSDAFAAAMGAFENGNFSEALSEYQQALALVPQNAGDPETLVSQLQSSATRLQRAERAREDTQAAAPLITSGQQAVEAGNYREAIRAFTQALLDYPFAENRADAVTGITRAVSARQQENSRALAELRSQRDELQSELASLREESRDSGATADAREVRIAELEQELAESESRLRQRVSELQNRSEELQDELSRARSNLAQLREEQRSTEQELEAAREQAESAEQQLAGAREELTDTREELSSTRRELTATRRQLSEREAGQASTSGRQAPGDEGQAERTVADAELREELEQLRSVEETVRQVRREYGDFVQREQELIQSAGEIGRVQAKLLLDSFLASEPVDELMPDLRERIKRYDAAFEQAGRESALLDVVDIVYTLSTYRSAGEKLDYLDQIQEDRSNPAFSDFIAELKLLVEEESGQG